jgi:hypothetical protein
MRNWKTSLAGCVTALAAFVAFSPALFARWPWVAEVAKFTIAGGFASMGLAAKDGTNHSTAAEVMASTAIEKSEEKKTQ